MSSNSLTPAEIVEKLDQHIIGQADDKRAVAIALCLTANMVVPLIFCIGLSMTSSSLWMGAVINGHQSVYADRRIFLRC